MVCGGYQENMKLGWRIWMLLIVLAFSLLSIFVSSNGITFFSKGAIITSVESDSTAFEQGMRQGQIIVGIDGKEIKNFQDYTDAISGKFVSNKSVKTEILINDAEFILFTNSVPEIIVSNVPKTNIKLGLDLAGGARALVKAQDFSLSSDDAQELSAVIKNRLNVYGLEDIKVNPISDLAGNNFIRIEIAGATPEDLENLVSEQGKFEAKIGNETVFVGGEKDIASVARSGQEAVVESCTPIEDGTYFCNFRFTIFLSEDAAKKHAELTKNLEANYTTISGNYLSQRLDLFLDGNLVDSLLISDGLKGVVTTQISISGSGSGADQNQAYDEAILEMNRLQTILITGSLPYKLEIVKLDTLSPLLGEQFIYLILLAGSASIFAVSIIIFARYRKIKESFAVLFTSFSEIIIILGIASLIGWNLDLPSIAGILATIGTGVDQQIAILDEARRGKGGSLSEKMKQAIFVVMSAYATSLVSLLPLYWAGAGLFLD